MKKHKKNKNDFEIIDDYFEEEGDSFLMNQSIESDLSDVSYEEFNKANNVVVEDDDDDDDVEEVKTTKTVTKKTTTTTTKHKEEESGILANEGLMDFLTFFWTWFRRIGIVIAVILMAYYLTEGLFKDLFLYILLLIAAFFFGYGFMAVINMVMDGR